MLKKLSLLLLLCAQLSVALLPHLDGVVGGKRVLVLVDDMRLKETHSIFFSSLADIGFKLDFQYADSQALALSSFGEHLYDNVLLFAPKTDDFGSLDAGSFISFIEEGGNLMIAGDVGMSKVVRQLAGYLGFEFDKKGSQVIDHFAYDESNDFANLHTAVLVEADPIALESGVILGNGKGNALNGPILYRGVGHAIEEDNVLAQKIVVGNPTSYSGVPGNYKTGANVENTGKDTVLISAVQAANNARVTVAGSLSVLSNKFMLVPGVANYDAGVGLGLWALGQSGILRARDVIHHRQDGTAPELLLHEKEKPDLPASLFPDPEIARNTLVYRIRDEIVYSICIEEHAVDTATGETAENDAVTDAETATAWSPYRAEDVQLEFVMLDPYLRTELRPVDSTTNFTATSEHACGGTRYEAKFMAPDTYGIFKFRLMYRRPGYTTVHVETQVSVRPYKHNEYERFIFSAYPYYGTALGLMGAFFIFSFLFLHVANPDKPFLKN